MARNDDRDWIAAVGVSDSSSLARFIDQSGEVRIAHRGAVRNCLQCLPYALLKWCAGWRERQLEVQQPATEVGMQLAGGFHEDCVFPVGIRRSGHPVHLRKRSAIAYQ